MAMADIDQQGGHPTIEGMREELSCIICRELFTVPKTLPCLHTFCEKCLLDAEAARRRPGSEAEKEDPNDVECPTCRSKCTTKGGIKTLLTNFNYVNLVEHINIHSSVVSQRELICGKCREELKAPAVAYCYSCNAPICAFCLDMHNRFQEFRSHQFFTLDEIRKTGALPPSKDTHKYLCQKHLDQELRLYCFTCEEVICRDCTVTKTDHRDHDYQFINRLVHDERQKLRKHVEPLHNVLKTVTDCSAKVKEQKEALKKIHEGRVSKIDQVMGEVRERLKLRGESLKEESEKIFSERDKHLSLELEGIEETQVSVSSAIDFAKNTLERGSDVEVFLYRKRILARAKTLEEMRAKFQEFKVTDEDNVQFVCDHSIVEKFGRLCEAACPETTIVYGPGLEDPMQGKLTTFTVHAHDKLENPLQHGGGQCIAQITCTPPVIGKMHSISPDITDNTDGSYTVAFTPEYPGRTKVMIKMDGAEIKGSPFDIRVARNYVHPVSEPAVFTIPKASPWGLAMVSDTELAITASDCQVHLYTINGDEIGTVRSNFTRPYGISTDHEGYLWITDREAHTVQKFERTSSGEFHKLFQFGVRGINAGQFSHPRGIAVNPANGYIYISDMKNNRIQVFKPDSDVPTYVHQFGAPGKNIGCFNLPAGLCFNKDGNLVVCDDHNCRLQVFDPNGRFLKTLGTTSAQKGLLCSPIGIATDFKGRYILTEFGSHCVTFLSPKGDILNCMRTIGEGYGQFVHPRGVAVDSAGYVYVADNENMRVARF